MDKSRRAAVKPRNREMVRRYKLRKGCASCGYKKYHGALHLHHTEPKNTGGKAVQYQWSPTKVKAEVRKCIVLCANCHAETHGGINA